MNTSDYLSDQKPADWRRFRTYPAILQAYDSGLLRLSDQQLDQLLRLTSEPTEYRFSDRTLEQRYGLEQFTYEGTPYNFIRYFLHVLRPTKTDIVYDLGAGYGRVLFYGAITTPALYRGIEIVAERVEQMENVRQALSLSQVELVRANVLDVDFSSGTIFFLFNPFADSTLQGVIRRLAQLSQQRPIKIVAWGGPANARLSSQPWLRERPVKLVFNRLHIYDSLT